VHRQSAVAMGRRPCLSRCPLPGLTFRCCSVHTRPSILDQANPLNLRDRLLESKCCAATRIDLRGSKSLASGAYRRIVFAHQVAVIHRFVTASSATLGPSLASQPYRIKTSTARGQADNRIACTRSLMIWIILSENFSPMQISSSRLVM
jgi:hypothetical protein